MAEFPNCEQMAKEIAEKALDEFLYDGKSIREWMKILGKEEPRLIEKSDGIIEQIKQEPSEEYKRGWHDAIITALKETHDYCTDDGVFRAIQEESLVGVGMSMQEPKTDVSDIYVGKWVSVSERLPKENGTSTKCLVTIGAWVGTATFVEGRFWQDYSEQIVYYHVTAWMPLPEPYKEVNK